MKGIRADGAGGSLPPAGCLKGEKITRSQPSTASELSADGKTPPATKLQGTQGVLWYTAVICIVIAFLSHPLILQRK
jgi:hypothetical protein